MNTIVIAAEEQAKSEHQSKSTPQVSSYDAYIMAMYYAMQGNQSDMAEQANAMQVKENQLQIIDEQETQLQNETKNSSASAGVSGAIIGASVMGNRSSVLSEQISQNGGLMQADSTVNRMDATQGTTLIRSFASYARVRV